MRWVFGACVAILAGCATVPPAPAPASRAAELDGSVWELPDANAGRPVTLEFRGQDGGGLAIAGYDGCNRFNGPAELGEGEVIRFPRLAITRMACLANTAAIERRVMTALEATRAMRVEGTALKLLGGESQILLTYRRQ
jgi:heat shock protein HslJ